MKSFKELRESSNPSMVQTTVDANIINNLVKFAQQLSGSFQPDMILIINKIENELNKFGLTLGDVDVDTPFEDSGTDDYVIQFYATKEPVKNMFLTLSWRKISGKQFEYTQEGAKLIHDVHLIVNITDPEDMDDILNSEDGDDEMTFVHLDEATIKTKEYSWGKIKTIHHGTDWSIPLHPEHQKAISSLEDEEETRFKDETGAKWRAIRFGDTIHFTGGDRGTYYGGTYKTSVLRKHLTEDMDSLDGDDEMTFVHLDEATIKTKEYSWGKIKTIHHGTDWSIPLHPEHQKAISSLEDEEETRFKDETGAKWRAIRFGDTIHFTGGDRGTYYGGTYKTSVLRKHLTEDMDSLDGDEQDCIKEALGRHEQGWDRSKSKLFDSKGKYEVAFVHPKTDEEITKTLDANDIKHAKEQIRRKHGDNVRIINARPLEESSIKKKFCDFRSNHDNLNESLDDIDYIKINIPAFIRCLEHAMEDVKEDAELHEFVENLLEISKTKDTITTDDYEKAVSDYDKGE